jgi:hypothetical protein
VYATLIPSLTLLACRREDGRQPEVVLQAQEVSADSNGTMVVTDEYEFALPEREHFLQRARESYLRHDMRMAAEHLRHAALELRREEGRASGDVRAALRASDRELEQLAKDLDAGVRVSDEAVRHALARAHLAFVQAHRGAAMQERRLLEGKRGEQELRQLSAALDGAAGHLEWAAEVAGRQADAEIRDAVRQTHQLAGRLRNREAVPAGAVNDALSRVGAAADRLLTTTGVR